MSGFVKEPPRYAYFHWRTSCVKQFVTPDSRWFFSQPDYCDVQPTMPYGLSTFETLSIIGPILGAAIMVLVNVLQYDKQENSQVASRSKSERWDQVKRNYGRIVSKHYISIDNTANTFIDLSDPDDSAETMDDFIDDPNDFLEIHSLISEMEKPELYHSRCRKGAEWAPLGYTGSLFSTILAIIFWDGFLFVTVALFVIALALTGVFLLYRAKLNGIADEVQFTV